MCPGDVIGVHDLSATHRQTQALGERCLPTGATSVHRDQRSATVHLAGGLQQRSTSHARDSTRQGPAGGSSGRNVKATLGP
jgi:hypothetical protein